MKLICPHCKMEIDSYNDIDCYDIDYHYSSVGLVTDNQGKCRYCAGFLTWREYYGLKRVQDTTNRE